MGKHTRIKLYDRVQKNSISEILSLERTIFTQRGNHFKMLSKAQYFFNLFVKLIQFLMNEYYISKMHNKTLVCILHNSRHRLCGTKFNAGKYSDCGKVPG